MCNTDLHKPPKLDSVESAMFATKRKLKKLLFQPGAETAGKWVQLLTSVSLLPQILSHFGSLIKETLRSGGVEVGTFKLYLEQLGCLAACILNGTVTETQTQRVKLNLLPNSVGG